jgi:hypothetical protein
MAHVHTTLGTHVEHHDQLTEVLDEADALARHLVERLDADDLEIDDCYPLMLIAKHLSEKHERIRAQAGTWLDACRPARA